MCHEGDLRAVPLWLFLGPGRRGRRERPGPLLSPDQIPGLVNEQVLDEVVERLFRIPQATSPFGACGNVRVEGLLQYT
jgi:hypothetical protein